MSKRETRVLKEKLFTVRYMVLIDLDGFSKDNISNFVTRETKLELAKVMISFDKPIKVPKNRYSNEKIKTKALTHSIGTLNDIYNREVFYIYDNSTIFYEKEFNPSDFAWQFTPLFFDVIQLQYYFLSSEENKENFRNDINDVFDEDRVPFRLRDDGLIVQDDSFEVVTDLPVSIVENIKEPGLKELIQEAIEKHRQSNTISQRDAVEKVWDALERIKTVYEKDKNKSVKKLIGNLTDEEKFQKMFDTEFTTLTKIGNDYAIRHHETDKTEIADVEICNYLFNRCMSLITLVIKILDTEDSVATQFAQFQ